ILARIIWVYPAAYIPRLFPHIRRREPPPTRRGVFLVAWVGLRGIVSLAAALALPTAAALPDGAWPYERNMILLLTFAVILVTLVGQGLTLPLVIKALHLRGDN